jgi:predicted dehydrogenase
MTRSTSSERLSRRCFLGNTVGWAASPVLLPTIIPAGVLATAARPGANDRIGIGYIGAGRRANQLMSLPPEGRIVAVADVDRSRAESVAARRQCDPDQDYRQLLDRRDVDAVFITTPDHWHALPSIHACQAGKDVYLEKPLSLTIREGRQIVNAARKYSRVFQTGSQRRSMSGHRRGCELVRNGWPARSIPW